MEFLQDMFNSANDHIWTYQWRWVIGLRISQGTMTLEETNNFKEVLTIFVKFCVFLSHVEYLHCRLCLGSKCTRSMTQSWCSPFLNKLNHSLICVIVAENLLNLLNTLHFGSVMLAPQVTSWKWKSDRYWEHSPTHRLYVQDKIYTYMSIPPWSSHLGLLVFNQFGHLFRNLVLNHMS